MKKVLFITLFLLAALISYSQKIETSSNIEVGYEDRRLNLYDLYDNEYLPIGSYKLFPFYGSLYLDAKFKGFSLFTSNKTYFKKAEKIYFQPLQSEFTVGLNYKWKKLTFEASHMCSHGIDKKYLRESYDRVSLKYELF